MSNPIRIANCSGFYGDRLSAAAEMVEGGPIDVLTGDWLAELTMLILARTQAKHPGRGYARSFIRQMEQVMGTCLDKDIRVVANAGGLNPNGCAEAVAEVANKLGLSPTIAYVDGDDLIPRLTELLSAGIDLPDPLTGAPLEDPSGFISANAYLGCWGIVEALNRGADIVVTGRTTDAAVVCGPAAWHHGWSQENWDALAGAVVAGHVIECGTQATGGNYSFFTEIPGLERAGFPWAEINADGSSIIGKHDGTGGTINIGTVTSQLLYEIAAPSYFGPDVTARFDTIRLNVEGTDRVRISGTKGEPPPPTLKVSMNRLGGYRTDLSIGLTGLDVDAKAELVEAAFWRACPLDPSDFDEVTSQTVYTGKDDPASNEEAVAQWCLTIKDVDDTKLGRGLLNAINELALASIPGFFVTRSNSNNPKPFGIHRSGLIPAEFVPQHVVLIGGDRTVIESVIPNEITIDRIIEPVPAPVSDLPTGPTIPTPLGHVVGTRSGDKGGDANLGVFTRTPAAWVWLESFLTTEYLRALLPEAAHLEIDRHPLPNLLSVNFVIHGLLGEGVAASTRQDAQAKGLGEWLRARVVDVPQALLV